LVAEERRRRVNQRIKEADQRDIPWMIGEILEFVQERSPEPVDKSSLYHWFQREKRIKSGRGGPPTRNYTGNNY
jgi:hypothetical protein